MSNTLAASIPTNVLRAPTSSCVFFCYDVNIYQTVSLFLPSKTCSFSVLLSWSLVPPCCQRPWNHLEFLSPFCKSNQLTCFCWSFLSNIPYICPLLPISFSTLSWGSLFHTWKTAAASSLVTLPLLSSTPIDWTHWSQSDLSTTQTWPCHSQLESLQ